MTGRTYETSLYIASLTSSHVPTRHEVREAMSRLLQEMEENRNILLKMEGNDLVAIFNGTLISFRVNDATKDRIYLLTFWPRKRKTQAWYQRDCEDSQRNVLDFCDLLGNEFQLILSGNIYEFKRVAYAEDKMLDISSWEVDYPCENLPRRETLQDLMSVQPMIRYENVCEHIPKDTTFHIFTRTYLSGGNPLLQLQDTLRGYGSISNPRSLDIAKEFSEKLARKAGCALIFLETKELLSQSRNSLKAFFSSNNLPSQFILDRTITDKITRGGIKANLLLEILTKMGRPPIVLQAPEEVCVNGGFLCLSDIENATKKLFGALFTYSNQGLEVKAEVQIYADIDYIAKNWEIEIPDDSIDLLARKASTLFGGVPFEIDILFTKEWSLQKIHRLVSSLKNENIETERAYYLSSCTSRFVDEYLEGNRRSLKHPYVILGPKTGFLKTATEIRLFPHLFSNYVKLVWPEDGILNSNDLEKVLWLVKKRIYRIQEFYTLKIPEPMQIFKDMKNMYLGEIKEKLTIPLNLMI